MGCRAPPDLVMASAAELMKRLALVMKTQTSMRMHLVLPQHCLPVIHRLVLCPTVSFIEHDVARHRTSRVAGLSTR